MTRRLEQLGSVWMLLGLLCGCDSTQERERADAALPAEAGRPQPGPLDAAIAVPICDALGEQPCSQDASIGVPAEPCGQDEPCADEPCQRADGGCEAPSKASCDARRVLCKRAPPVCSAGEVPSVVDTCYGGCVPISSCVCNEADACPQRGQYVCHMSAGRCGPYVN